VIEKLIPYSKLREKNKAFNSIKGAAESGAFNSLKVKASFEYKQSSYEIVATGKGFKLSLLFREDSVQIGLELGFLYKALRSQIESALEKELSSRI